MSFRVKFLLVMVSVHIITVSGKVVRDYLPSSVSKGGVQQVEIGSAHAIALLSTGTIVQWGASALPAPKGLRNVLRVYAGGNNSAALLDRPPYLKVWGQAVSQGIIKIKPFTAQPHQFALGAFGALLLDDRGKIHAYGRCLPIPSVVAKGITYDVFSTGMTCWAHGEYGGYRTLYAWNPAIKFAKAVDVSKHFSMDDVLFIYPTQQGFLFIGTAGFDYYAVARYGVMRNMELSYKEIGSMAAFSNGDFYAVEVMDNDDGNDYAVLAGNVYKKSKTVKVSKAMASAAVVKCGDRYGVAQLDGSRLVAFGTLKI